MTTNDPKVTYENWEPDFTRKPLVHRMQDIARRVKCKANRPLLKQMGNGKW